MGYPLVIMDLGLPDHDGYDVTAQIHQWQQDHQQPLSLVVAVSAHLGETEHQRCLSVGMIRAYVKPLTQEIAEALLILAKNYTNTE